MSGIATNLSRYFQFLTLHLTPSLNLGTRFLLGGRTVTPRPLSSVIRLNKVISSNSLGKAQAGTSPVRLGGTGLTGRDNRSDRSNWNFTVGGPHHLNHSLCLPQPLPPSHRTELELGLSRAPPLTPNPRAQSSLSIGFQGRGELQIGQGSSPPRSSPWGDAGP